MIRSSKNARDSLPTLRRRFFARFSVGAAIALAVVLAVSLFLADALAARWTARSLLQDLEDGLYQAIPGGMGGPTGMGGAMGMGARRMRGMGGTLLLTTDTLRTYEAVWPDARRIQSSQATYGSGRVPWAREPVVWAARRQEDGGGAVQMAWTRLSAVRAAAAGTYILVAAATVASFAVGAFVTDIGVKKVAQAVRAAADTSRPASSPFMRGKRSVVLDLKQADDVARRHADRNIARALEQHQHIRQGGQAGDILAGVGLGHAQPAAGQEVERFFFHAAFAGQRETDLFGHGRHLRKQKRPPADREASQRT